MDGVPKVWDLAGGAQVLSLDGQAQMCDGIAYSPDGAHLATVGGDGLARTYTLQMDELVRLARSLTRTLSDGECRQYLHLEQCPAAP